VQPLIKCAPAADVGRIRKRGTGMWMAMGSGNGIGNAGAGIYDSIFTSLLVLATAPGHVKVFFGECERGKLCGGMRMVAACEFLSQQ